MNIHVNTCVDCGCKFMAKVARMTRCNTCQRKRDAEYFVEWRKINPDWKKRRANRQKEYNRIRAAAARSMLVEKKVVMPERIGVTALERFIISWDAGLSKNELYGRKPGAIFLRDRARKLKQAIISMVVLKTGGRWPVGKIWVDIIVQKDSQKADAVNVVDILCDAIKDGIGVDDKWFSLGLVDWEVSKIAPKIVFQIYRYHSEPKRVCYSCGEVRDASEFWKRSAGGMCLRCRTIPVDSIRRRGVAAPDNRIVGVE